MRVARLAAAAEPEEGHVPAVLDRIGGGSGVRRYLARHTNRPPDTDDGADQEHHLAHGGAEGDQAEDKQGQCDEGEDVGGDRLRADGRDHQSSDEQRGAAAAVAHDREDAEHHEEHPDTDKNAHRPPRIR